MRAQQVVELSPSDAERLGVRDGDLVELGSNGTRVSGPVRLRAAIPHGSVFIAEGTAEDPSNVLSEALVAVRRIGGQGDEGDTGAAVVQSAPGPEGLAEAAPSAPLAIPPGGASQSEDGSSA